MYHVIFKGLENIAFEFSPVAFTIGEKPVYWYGILITCGIILTVLYAFWRAGKLGVKTDDMYDYAIFTIIFGILGARYYFVLTNLEMYETFWDTLAIWEGGLGIYGGIIAGAITVAVVSFVKKINPLTVLDAVAPSVMIGQLIGRWGNYVNQEAFGSNTTLPWGMKSWVVSGSSGISMQGTREYLQSAQGELAKLGVTVDPEGFVHPTFLYESLWNLIGFVIIHFLYKKRTFKGQMLLLYLAWYGLGRGFIEMLRTDSLLIPGTTLRISMVFGFACFIVCTALLIIFGIRAKKHPQELEKPIVKAPEEKKNTDDTASDDTSSDDTTEDDDTANEIEEEENPDDITDLEKLDGADDEQAEEVIDADADEDSTDEEASDDDITEDTDNGSIN